MQQLSVSSREGLQGESNEGETVPKSGRRTRQVEALEKIVAEIDVAMMMVMIKMEMRKGRC